MQERQWNRLAVSKAKRASVTNWVRISHWYTKAYKSPTRLPKIPPLADDHFATVGFFCLFFFILQLCSLGFISRQGWNVQDISHGCNSSIDRRWVYQHPKTGTTWKDINEATDPSHCEYHKFSPGRPGQGCTARRGMNRKTAACSVNRLPATLMNVELLSRLALHHTERVYFANDLWEGWGW